VEFGYTATIDEFNDGIEKILALEEARSIGLRGLVTVSWYLISNLMNVYNQHYDRFVKVNGEYVYGATLDGTVQGIAKLREMYQRGILDPDFYLAGTYDDSRNIFNAGGAAALWYGSSPDHIVLTIDAFQASNDTTDPYEDIGQIFWVDDNKTFHSNEQANYWSANLFKPGLEEVKFRRILELMDFLCTLEGQELTHLGLEGVDYKKDNSGEYVVLREKDENGLYPHIGSKYPSTYMWYTMTILPDSFGFVNPSIDVRARTTVIEMTKIMERGIITPIDTDVFFYTSDVKSQYSVDFNSTIIRLMMDANADIEAGWKAFIEENRPMWEPLLKEYNAAFGK